MVHIVFEYKDQYTHGNWSKQECTCIDVQSCKDSYGLGSDPNCEYRILSVEEVK